MARVVAPARGTLERVRWLRRRWLRLSWVLGWRLRLMNRLWGRLRRRPGVLGLSSLLWAGRRLVGRRVVIRGRVVVFTQMDSMVIAQPLRCMILRLRGTCHSDCMHVQDFQCPVIMELRPHVGVQPGGRRTLENGGSGLM